MRDLNLEICTVFNRQASNYDLAAKIQREIGTRLFERLSYIKISPKYILDLGCGTGVFSAKLQKLYPKAEIIGLDLAYTMLLESKRKQRLWQGWPLVNADMDKLPFADGLFDLIFANQTVHWAPSLPKLFKELSRVMKPNGCLMLSTLGPSTFQELREAWKTLDNYSHTNVFLDMHDVGDYLLAAKFSDPVMDMELLSVHYPDVSALVSSLKTQGVRNINPDRKVGLTSLATWRLFEQNYSKFRTEEGKYPLSYEVVYGHAWKNEKLNFSNTEISIPISAIKR